MTLAYKRRSPEKPRNVQVDGVGYWQRSHGTRGGAWGETEEARCARDGGRKDIRWMEMDADPGRLASDGGVADVGSTLSSRMSNRGRRRRRRSRLYGQRTKQVLAGNFHVV